MRRILAVVVCLASAAALLVSTPAPRVQVGPQPGGGFLLHSGWTLTPAGKQIPLSTLPMSTALSPDGKYLLILNGGYLPPSISVVDVGDERETARVAVEDAWLGLTFNRKGDRVYAGGGSKPFVFEFSFDNGELKPGRKFAVIQDPKPTDHVGDVALSPDGRFLYVASLFRNSLVVLNALTGFKVTEIPTGRRPYRTVFAPDGRTFYVSHWADSAVGQYSVADGSRLDTIRVGMNPTDLLYLPGKNDAAENEPAYVGRLFVACANTNSVFVLGVSEGNRARMIERINVALAPRAPAGTTPTGLALSPDGQRLYVANANNNTVAVVDVSEYQAEVLGFVPTGWYPTAVRAVADGRIFIANGRGRGSYPNPRGPQPTGGSREQYVGRIQTGSLSIVPPPDEEQLAEFSKQALRNSPYQDAKLDEKPAPLPAAIRHVLYIIKENRTYDQVLGDMKEGNGDPSLVLFGEEITPNHHKLAREFVLLDNFYVNADVSADGHHWSTAAIANDYVEKMWPSKYANRRTISDFGDEPAAFPPAGYLWTNAIAAGVSLRNWGMWVENNKELTGIARVRDAALAPYTDRNFVGFTLDYSDQKRADEFLREFEAMTRQGKLPRLLLMRLPNDHTSGTAARKLSPRALVADNDSALGRVVEAVSRSPVWNQTAIFVLEDDAQNGPDHVDSHRSPAYVLSAWSKRGFVDSTHYTTASMLRTMELILGLHPMTQFDAAATPMTNCFAARADLRPYAAEKPRVSLEERNPSGATGSAQSARMDFSEEDRIDDDELNGILWRSIRGSEPPAATRSYFGRARR